MWTADTCRTTKGHLLPVEFQRHCPYAIRVLLDGISPGADWLNVSTDKMVEFVSKEEHRDEKISYC